MPDLPAQLSPSLDNSALVTALNANFQSINNQFKTNIISDENGLPRYINGKLPDGTFGLVISKPGVDVTTLFS